MDEKEQEARRYVTERFPRATAAERKKIVEDWLAKDLVAEGIADDFERRVGPLAGLRVLDSGSGPGGIGIAFAARGATVDGVDIEPELINISVRDAARRGSSAHFALYEGRTLPFSDGSFDAAVSVSVIEHVDEPVRYFAELLRVMKAGGHLYLGFPNRLNPKETHTGLWFLSYLPLSAARLYVKLTGRNPLEDNGLHFYTYWAVKRFLRESAYDGRTWHLVSEEGRSRNPLKRATKSVLRALGIPYQAFLPHVMLILEAR
jgi:SAM-dependent methyltransferase